MPTYAPVFLALAVVGIVLGFATGDGRFVIPTGMLLFTAWMWEHSR